MQRENKQNNQKYLYKTFISSLHEILKLVKFHIKHCLIGPTESNNGESSETQNSQNIYVI